MRYLRLAAVAVRDLVLTFGPVMIVIKACNLLLCKSGEVR